MSKVLVVLAHPHTELKSMSMETYKTFMNEYRQQNPDDEIIIRDLFAQPVPPMNDDTFIAIAKQHAGMDLTDQQQKQLSTREEWLEEFMNADKYIFVNPMYNHFLPAELKEYIDITAVARKTFRYTSNGPEGLMKGKKALQIQAAGGNYHDDGPHGEFSRDFGAPYLEMMLNFYGIRDVSHIYVEGAAHHRDQANDVLETAQKQAVELAKTF